MKLLILGVKSRRLKKIKRVCTISTKKLDKTNID